MKKLNLMWVSPQNVRYVIELLPPLQILMCSIMSLTTPGASGFAGSAFAAAGANAPRTSPDGWTPARKLAVVAVESRSENFLPVVTQK